MLDEMTNNEEHQVEESTAEVTNEDLTAELEGYPEDVKENILAEMKTNEPEVQEDNPTAEADSDTKQYEGIEKPKGKIPYERFKAEVDKRKENEDKIASLEAELNKMRAEIAGRQQAQPPQDMARPQQPQQQGFRLTKDVMEKMEAAARVSAQNMLGFTQEDMDALEYADEDDEKKIMFKQALGIARGNVQSDVRRAIAQQREQAAQFLTRHQALVQEFNNYYTEQAKEPDFTEIQNYAREMINNASPVEKAAVSDAYARVQNNTASPQDVYTVQTFFEKAKLEYRSKNQRPNSSKNSNIVNQETKIKQANSFPRSQQVDGVATTDGAPLSVSNLEHMLQTRSWDDIPENVQQMLLGTSILDERG